MSDREPPHACGVHAANTCGVCRDDAVAGEVIAFGHGTTASCRVAGEVVPVALDLVGPVAIGDRLLIHLGFAIEKLEVR